MLSAPYLQTDTNGLGWLWIAILIILFLLVIIWWFRSRRAEPAGVPPARVRAEGAADDLIKIEGIGPKVASVLNQAGITTFEALASANPAEVQRILNDAGLQMMNPDGWIEQARLAAEGDWAALERLQGELKGGRKT
ncbi:MAG TPA: DUF4332 domain-containing protein [Anaerolineales bacterium]|nr:DUF4332 domain-containing protein [Anaerolineales bacterium]